MESQVFFLSVLIATIAQNTHHSVQCCCDMRVRGVRSPRRPQSSSRIALLQQDLCVQVSIGFTVKTGSLAKNTLISIRHLGGSHSRSSLGPQVDATVPPVPLKKSNASDSRPTTS